MGRLDGQLGGVDGGDAVIYLAALGRTPFGSPLKGEGRGVKMGVL